MNRNKRRESFLYNADERGVALLTSILALTLITVLGLALTTIGFVAVTAANNERQATQAFYAAESGLVHAKVLIEVNGTTNFVPRDSIHV